MSIQIRDGYPLNKNNIWSDILFSVYKTIIDAQKTTGKQFTIFLKNACQQNKTFFTVQGQKSKSAPVFNARAESA